GNDAVASSERAKRELRKTVQMVFQNPYASLNPRKKIGALLEAPLEINTDLKPGERSERGRAMLAKVGLRPEHYARYPHMFSGGQRQRIPPPPGPAASPTARARGWGAGAGAGAARG